MKEWLVSYLTFSKKERMGILVLLGLILLIWLLPEYHKKHQPLSNNIDSGDLPAVAEVPTVKETEEVRTTKLFYFDPNTVNDEQWEELGVKKRTIATIRNYLSKGGKFRQPADLAKIYGFGKVDAERLIPFVRIPRTALYTRPTNMGGVATERPAYPLYPRHANMAGAAPTRPAYQPYVRKVYERKAVMVDVNQGDSAAFEALPGIGTRLATRIVRFREALGGFHSIEQLRDVYGINDTVFNLIAASLTMHTGVYRKVRINAWDVDSIDMHPYIQKHEAKAIVKFRNQHGRFNNVDELGKINLFSGDWISRLKPYVDLE